MSSAWSMPLRALATQTAVLTMVGLGLAAPATAAPGDTGSDNRSDTATTAQVEASEKGSEQSQTRSGSSTTKASTKASGGSSTSAGTKGSTQSDNKGLDDDRHTPMGEQPVSHADQNDGGANGDCADDPTADSGYFCGTLRNVASGNGQGNGEATGKPWQAHKGKADNKNPPGQAQNDNNNGYECDGNQGIAKGNPAHTSCLTTTSGGGGGGGGGGFTPPGPPPVIPPGIGGVDTVVPPDVTPPVKGVELYRPPAQAPEAAPAQALPGAAVLPTTGATPAMTALSALAFGMLALGSGVLLYRRVTA